MRREYVPRMINLEPQDYQVVRRVADQRSLSEKGFSAALRMFIREWKVLQLREIQPLTMRVAITRSRMNREPGCKVRKDKSN